jgi:hypothetical protein
MVNSCELMIPLVIQQVYEFMHIESSNKFMNSNASWYYIIWTNYIVQQRLELSISGHRIIMHYVKVI